MPKKKDPANDLDRYYKYLPDDLRVRVVYNVMIIHGQRSLTTYTQELESFRDGLRVDGIEPRVEVRLFDDETFLAENAPCQHGYGAITETVLNRCVYVFLFVDEHFIKSWRDISSNQALNGLMYNRDRKWRLIPIQVLSSEEMRNRHLRMPMGLDAFNFLRYHEHDQGDSRKEALMKIMHKSVQERREMEEKILRQQLEWIKNNKPTFESGTMGDKNAKMPDIQVDGETTPNGAYRNLIIENFGNLQIGSECNIKENVEYKMRKEKRHQREFQGRASSDRHGRSGEENEFRPLSAYDENFDQFDRTGLSRDDNDYDYRNGADDSMDGGSRHSIQIDNPQSLPNLRTNIQTNIVPNQTFVTSPPGLKLPLISDDSDKNIPLTAAHNVDPRLDEKLKLSYDLKQMSDSKKLDPKSMLSSSSSSETLTLEEPFSYADEDTDPKTPYYESLLTRKEPSSISKVEENECGVSGNSTSIHSGMSSFGNKESGDHPIPISLSTQVSEEESVSFGNGKSEGNPVPISGLDFGKDDNIKKILTRSVVDRPGTNNISVAKTLSTHADEQEKPNIEFTHSQKLHTRARVCRGIEDECGTCSSTQSCMSSLFSEEIDDPPRKVSVSGDMHIPDDRAYDEKSVPLGSGISENNPIPVNVNWNAVHNPQALQGSQLEVDSPSCSSNVSNKSIYTINRERPSDKTFTADKGPGSPQLQGYINRRSKDSGESKRHEEVEEVKDDSQNTSSRNTSSTYFPEQPNIPLRCQTTQSTSSISRADNIGGGKCKNTARQGRKPNNNVDNITRSDRMGNIDNITRFNASRINRGEQRKDMNAN